VILFGRKTTQGPTRGHAANKEMTMKLSQPKSIIRVEQHNDGISAQFSRYMAGHSKTFHRITNASQARVEKIIERMSPSIFVEYDSIVIVAGTYTQ
jgi:hypothetical protein